MNRRYTNYYLLVWYDFQDDVRAPYSMDSLSLSSDCLMLVTPKCFNLIGV